MTFRMILIAFLNLPVFICAQSFQITDYFPTDTTKRWEYKTGDGQTKIARLYKNHNPENQQFFKIHFSENDQQFFLMDETGLYMTALKTNGGKYDFSNHIGITASRVRVGDGIRTKWLVEPSGISDLFNWGDVRVTVQAHLDKMDVGESTYNDVLQIIIYLYGKQPVQYFLAKDVGIIKATSPSTFGTRELVHAYSTSAHVNEPPQVESNRVGSGNVVFFRNPKKNAVIDLIRPNGTKAWKVKGYTEKSFDPQKLSLAKGRYFLLIQTDERVYEKSIILE